MAITKITTPELFNLQSNNTEGTQLPVMTRAERIAMTGMSNGELIFNSTTDSVEYYDAVAAAWYKIDYAATALDTELRSFLNASNAASYDGSQGTVWTDLTTNSNNGTLTNMSASNWNSSGYFDFNGSNEYVVMAHQSSLTNVNFSNNFSYSLWFRADSFTNNDLPTLFGTFGTHYTYTALNRLGDRKLRTTVLSTGQVQTDEISTTTLSTGVWYNATITKSDSSGANPGLTIYLYGPSGLLETMNSSTATQPNYVTNAYTTWGAYNSSTSWNYYFDGQMAQTRIYSKVLTSTEATAIFNEGPGF
jgi:hypothetical protein